MQVVDSEGYLKVKLVGGPVGPFVPYTGATANVDLGEYEIKAGQFTLDTSPTGTAVVGTTRWNDAIGSSETTLKGGSVILKNGADLVARVVNKVTPNTTLTKAGYAAVRVSGAQGQRLAVAYAQADSDANSADIIGLVTETIATNQEGFIMTVGQLEGVNTTGSLQGETWVDGSVLYLSPTIPGALTNIKPNGSTGHIVVMGYVEYAHAINGKIYVKIMNGWELDELHNVYINPATIANNNILQYDSADQLWKNKVLNTGITIGTTAITSGTVGRVLFEGTGNVVQQSSSLFWDATNNRLGVGTSSPTQTLDIQPPSGTATIRVARTGGTDIRMGASIISTGGLIGTYSASPLILLSNSAEAMRLFTTGNIGINTTTDAGFRLDVNGTARVQGALTLSAASPSITLGGDLTITSTAYPSRVASYDTLNSNLNLIAGGFGEGMFIGNRLTGSRTSTTFVSPDGLNAVGSAKITAYDGNGNTNIQASNNGNRSIVLRGLGAGGSVLIGNITTGNGTQYTSILTLESTTQGFLPPRMTTTQKNAIATPAAGLMVYDTTLNLMSVYNGTTWITL